MEWRIKRNDKNQIEEREDGDEFVALKSEADYIIESFKLKLISNLLDQLERKAA
jgi:hypothetical protein